VNEPLVSVVVTNYNYGRFLARAVGGVLAQSYPRVEIVAVDDGSTDDSLDVLRGYGARIRVIRQENSGVSAARNRGVRESRGELVAFLDSDDVWLEDKLARQVPLFDRESVGLVYCGLRFVDEEERSLGTTTATLRGRVLEELALLRVSGVQGGGSTAVVRRSVLDEVGGFDQALSTSADWDMWRRISCKHEIEAVSEPLVLYRQHHRGMHRNLDVFERDMLHAFDSMFRDPAARAVHPLRNRCYGNLYWMLAGCRFHAKSPVKSVMFLTQALAAWPPSLGRLLTAPIRRLQSRELR
jgi:glycosyltransferase involved in cell wall biosynthesis